MKISAFRKHIVFEGKHGRKFLADFVVPQGTGPFPVVIFSHGFKGFKDWGPFNLIADNFAENGFIFLKFNFAFNGTTIHQPIDFADLDAFGQNNFSKELDDLGVVIDWVHHNQQEINADLQRLSLIGHSRGGGISILKAGEDDRVKSVATWASVAEFARHITKPEILKWKKDGVILIENSRTGQQMPLYLQLYHDYISNHRRFNIRNAVKNLKMPLLIAHGTEDDTVPFSHALELIELSLSKRKLVQIEGGSHTFGESHPHQSNSLTLHFQEVISETQLFLKSL